MFSPARYVVEGVESVRFGLLCPALTNPLKRVEPAETLEALREVVRIEEGRPVRAEALVGLVVEPPNGRVLDRAIHAFDLAIGPQMVTFRQAMLDVQLGAGQVKGMGAKALMAGEHPLNLADTGRRLTAWRWKRPCGDDRVRCGIVACRA
jgi:hypothetical protein